MAGDAEQTDSSGKYTFGGGGAAGKKYWTTILKSIELVGYKFRKNMQYWLVLFFKSDFPNELNELY